MLWVLSTSHMFGRFLFSYSVQVVEAHLLLNPLTTFSGVETALLLCSDCTAMWHYPALQHH